MNLHLRCCHRMRVFELQALILGAVLFAGTAGASAATHTAASCAQRDVEAAVARASPGDTVLIPAGTAAWSSSMPLRKGIHLQGAGGGGFVGHSRTAQFISSGTKAFVTPAGLDLQVGRSVEAIGIADGTRFLKGTVTAYAGTHLELSVSATGGTGTHGAWVLAVPASTTIINHAANHWNRAMIDVFEDTANGVEIQMIVMSLRRNCLYAGHAYPVPRQVGQGHDGAGYVLDPLYIWDNPGNPRVGVNDYEPDEVGRDLRTADYLKPGRDYHVGVARPGYQKSTYPHPLRKEGL